MKKLRFLEVSFLGYLLCASFFAPLPSPWMNVVIYGILLFIQFLYQWYLSSKGPQSLCKTFILNVRSATLIVLLSSWIWSGSTVEVLSKTDEMMMKAINSFPEHVKFRFSINTSTFSVEGFNASNNLTIFPILLENQFLDAYRSEMSQTPVLDMWSNMQTIGSFYEFWYRLLQGPWFLPPKSPELTSSVVEVYEYQVDDIVFIVSGRKYLNEKKEIGKIKGIFPFPLLDRFYYSVEHIEDNGKITKEKAMNLLPTQAKFYFFPDISGKLDEALIPNDALAIFTRTHIAILQGFSKYFNQYWRYQIAGGDEEELLQDIGSIEEEGIFEKNSMKKYQPVKKFNELEMCPAPILELSLILQKILKFQ